jgi:restriction system protein
MEELVGVVFREHYDCEVIHCGQTGDKGIDLFLVLSDELVPIQVKRRMTSNKTESVETIRRMLGVMYRDGFKKAIIVSTANKYSRAAQTEAGIVIDRGVADYVNLVNVNNFISIMKQYYSGNEKNYFDVIKSLIPPEYKK